jgi:hypothetical protein
MSSNNGYTNDGYNVVINADDLLGRARHFQSQQAKGNDARQHLLDSVVPADAFGSIPGAAQAASRLRECLGKHMDAIAQAGVSIEYFAARVQAAGEIASDAEPATVKVSRIPDVFTDANGG